MMGRKKVESAFFQPCFQLIDKGAQSSMKSALVMYEVSFGDEISSLHHRTPLTRAPKRNEKELAGLVIYFKIFG